MFTPNVGRIVWPRTSSICPVIQIHCIILRQSCTVSGPAEDNLHTLGSFKDSNETSFCMAFQQIILTVLNNLGKKYKGHVVKCEHYYAISKIQCSKVYFYILVVQSAL